MEPLSRIGSIFFMYAIIDVNLSNSCNLACCQHYTDYSQSDDGKHYDYHIPSLYNNWVSVYNETTLALSHTDESEMLLQQA